MSSQFGSHRRRIAVCATHSTVTDTNIEHQSLWEVVPCSTPEELLVFVEAETLDAIALPFEPLDENAREMFLRLSMKQKGQRPFLISYSTFNPDWIENLAFGAGSNMHIRGDLIMAEVLKILNDRLEVGISPLA